MTVNVAINGFGRIGRLAYRRIKELGDTDLKVVAVNDLTSNEDLAYLLKYDTAQGTLPYEVKADDDSIVVDGEKLKAYEEKDASKLPWGDLNIDIVLECTGFYTSKEKAQAHIDAGARKVLISAPVSGDTKMIVFGVNNDTAAANTATHAKRSSPDGRYNPSGVLIGIPASTAAAIACGNVVSEVDGFVDGTAVRIPTITGSLVEL